MRMERAFAAVVLMCSCLAAACGEGGGARDAGPAAGAGGTASAAALAADMRSHLLVMEGAGGDELVAMVPQHRRMVTQLIERVGQERSPAGAGGGAAGWDALVDSVQRDLDQMSEMDAAELEEIVPPHNARLRRLIELSGHGP